MSTDANKPTKSYFFGEFNKIELGQRAFVNADPKGDYVFITTEVLSHNANTGEFETKNTRYRLFSA